MMRVEKESLFQFHQCRNEVMEFVCWFEKRFFCLVQDWRLGNDNARFSHCLAWWVLIDQMGGGGVD